IPLDGSRGPVLCSFEQMPEPGGDNLHVGFLQHAFVSARYDRNLHAVLNEGVPTKSVIEIGEALFFRAEENNLAGVWLRTILGERVPMRFGVFHITVGIMFEIDHVFEFDLRTFGEWRRDTTADFLLQPLAFGLERDELLLRRLSKEFL